MGTVVDDPAQEGLGLDALAHEPALHVGERDDQRVDLPVADHRLELFESGVLRVVVLRGHQLRLLYFAVIPPSATMTEPVTNDDSSEARKSATLAISRGSPGRPIGWKESIVA